MKHSVHRAIASIDTGIEKFRGKDLECEEQRHQSVTEVAEELSGCQGLVILQDPTATLSVQVGYENYCTPYSGVVGTNVAKERGLSEWCTVHATV